MSVKNYASYIALQEKRNIFNASKLINEDKKYFRDDEVESDSEHEKHVKAMDHAYDHMHKKKYKINYEHGGETSSNLRHDAPDGTKAKPPHKNPDITVHHDYEDGEPHVYTVHKNGAAANDKTLHKSILHQK